MSLYDDLGLAAHASPKDIRAAYHRLARQHHPDRGAADDEAFKRVSHAYETLSDPAQRARYDSRPRPLLPIRVVAVPVRTLVRGGVVELVHACPCPCRCTCELMGKTYNIEGMYRRVRSCAAQCKGCRSTAYVPPGTRDGEVFGDNGHVRFVASAIVSKDLRLVGGRLVGQLEIPLLEALTGFTRVVEGETIAFAPTLFAGRTALVHVTLDDVDYEVTLRL